MASVSSDAGSADYSGLQQPPQGGQYSPSPRNNPHLPHHGKPKLTQEELKVLEECNTESFWYRCVPLSAAFCGGTTYLVKTGYLKPHPRFGALFKNLGAVFVAYIIGKVSYQRACQQKILEKIPNSNLAQAIRTNKGLRSPIDADGGDDSTVRTYSSPREEKMREVYSSMDVSDSKPQNVKELDDSFRPTIDRDIKAKEVSPAESTQPSLSYDELRQRNRQEHEHAVGSSSRNPFRQQAFRTPEVVPSQESVPAFSSSVQSETENAFRAPENTDRPSASSRAGKKKNAYGDVWEE